MKPLDALAAAKEALRNAHFAASTRLPGWRIYYDASRRIALNKWKQFKEEMRATS